MECIPCHWVNNLHVGGMDWGFNCKDAPFMTLPLLNMLLHLQRESQSALERETSQANLHNHMSKSQLDN